MHNKIMLKLLSNRLFQVWEGNLRKIVRKKKWHKLAATVQNNDKTIYRIWCDCPMARFDILLPINLFAIAVDNKLLNSAICFVIQPTDCLLIVSGFLQSCWVVLLKIFLSENFVKFLESHFHEFGCMCECHCLTKQLFAACGFSLYVLNHSDTSSVFRFCVLKKVKECFKKNQLGAFCFEP